MDIKTQDLIKILYIHNKNIEAFLDEIISYFNVSEPERVSHIFFNIDCLGGDVKALEKIINAKSVYPGKVIGFVSGTAQSSAFAFLQLCCDLRLGVPNAELRHKDMVREINFEISPATQNEVAHKWIDNHIAEVSLKQENIEKMIAEKTGISFDLIVSMKSNGILSGTKAAGCGLLDKVFPDAVSALVYTKVWLAKQR